MAVMPVMTLRQVACQLHCRLAGASLNHLGPIGILSNYHQVRQRSNRQSAAQYKVQPEWFTAKTSRVRDEGLTLDNELFVRDIVQNTYSSQSAVLKEDFVENHEFHKLTRRCGVLAVKIGVLPQWTKEGKKFLVTLLQVIDNHVIRYTPPEEFVKSAGWKPWWGHRFGSVVVGCMSSDPRMFTNSYINLFNEAGVPPKKILTRFIVTPDAAIQPGTPLTAMHYRVGDYIDVQSRTIDHGFQGVVKRWGMKGMPASHGVTKAHRKMGSTGGGGNKAAIWKGKKMPGHMGDKRSILRGLKIWRINTKYNVLYVQGPNVAGHTHGIVRINDTILPTKRPTPDNHPPLPTWRSGEEEEGEELPREIFDSGLHRMSDPSLEFE